jgi:hypothetical protein
VKNVEILTYFTAHNHHSTLKAKRTIGATAMRALLITLQAATTVAMHTPQIVAKHGGLFIDGQPFAPTGDHTSAQRTPLLKHIRGSRMNVRAQVSAIMRTSQDQAQTVRDPTSSRFQRDSTPSSPTAAFPGKERDDGATRAGLTRCPSSTAVQLLE